MMHELWKEGVHRNMTVYRAAGTMLVLNYYIGLSKWKAYLYYRHVSHVLLLNELQARMLLSLSPDDATALVLTKIHQGVIEE